MTVEKATDRFDFGELGQRPSIAVTPSSTLLSRPFLGGLDSRRHSKMSPCARATLPAIERTDS